MTRTTIAGMEAWYASLKADGKLPENTSFTVTGHSLGGRLACNEPEFKQAA